MTPLLLGRVIHSSNEPCAAIAKNIAVEPLLRPRSAPQELYDTLPKSLSRIMLRQWCGVPFHSHMSGLPLLTGGS
jgi:hypothetical protein